MAKELPYYQFEVAEYLAGDIMICSLGAQGLFAVIKCLYWQKECSLNIKQVLRRYDREVYIDELTDEGIIKVNDDGEISITFLDVQYKAFKERREKLSNAGRKGGLTKKEATLKPPLNEVKATLKHLEESRVEKSIIEKNIIDDIKKRKDRFKTEVKNFLPSYSRELLKEFFDYWTEHGVNDRKMRFEKQISFDLKKRIQRWKKKDEESFKPKKNINNKTVASEQDYKDLQNEVNELNKKS